MKTKQLILAAVALAVLAFVPMAAKADAVFIINNTPQTGSEGSLLTFNATVTNVGTADITITGSSFNFPIPASATLEFNDDLFLTNFFGQTLGPTDMITADIFTVNILAGTAAGSYLGTYTIEYDSGAPTTQEFTVIVQAAGAAIPEPDSMVLLGTGLAGVVASLRKRRRAKRS